MEKLLNTRPAVIFSILIIGFIFTSITIPEFPLITSVFQILGFLSYLIYPLIVGHFLAEYLPNKIKLNNSFFLINFFIVFASYSLIAIISDGKGMVFNGLAAIPFLYNFYAFVYFCAFPAKIIKSIELNKEAELGEYIADFFLILFLPIGIWFIQPRINKIVQNQIKETAQ